MANRLTTFGNDLYTGKRSFNFVGGRKKWYAIAAVLIILSVAVPLLRGVQFSIEFRGGSQFQIAGVEDATAQVMDELEGGFAVVIMDKHKILGLRDGNGVRPLIIGELNGGYVFASEPSALQVIGASFRREVRHGMYRFESVEEAPRESGVPVHALS